MANKKLIRWLLPLALLLLGVVLGRLSLPSKTTPTQKTVERAVMAVNALHPKAMFFEQKLSANGSVVAVDTASVSGRLTGVVIERVLVDVGDHVKAGQALAVLDTKGLAEQVAQAQADLSLAVANKDHALANLARTEPLLAIDAVSRQEVDSHRTAVRQAQASIDAAQARLNTAKNNQKNAIITAPVSGVVSAKQAQVGVLTTGASLFSIIKDNALEWQASISPAWAEQIHKGQQVQLMVNQSPVTAQVTKLSPTANQARELIAHVRLPAGTKTQAGSYHLGEFIISHQSHQAIPMSALMIEDGHEFVWQLTAQPGGLYRVSRTKIQTRASQAEYVATDLPTDALIVAEGASFLRENDLVQLASIDGH